MTSTGANSVSSNPVRAREFEALGLRSHVIEAGTVDAAEAVVMMHGGPGASEDWALLLPEVGKFARAVAFDLPGFGKADKPRHWWGYSPPGWATFCAAALSELGIERAHLVVHDLAGGPALNWVASHPGALRSATLINTGDLIGYRWHAIGKLHRAPVFGPLAAIGGRVGMGVVMRLYEPRLPKEVVQRWRRDYDWGTRRAVLRFYRSTPAAAMGGLAATIRRLDTPALVIWGANNRFVPVEQAERQRESFPSAEVIVLENSGHYSHIDSPDRVAELVLPFLERQLG
jgi:pimeloyl-ACP methyl ester carboxylesterase